MLCYQCTSPTRKCTSRIWHWYRIPHPARMPDGQDKKPSKYSYLSLPPTRQDRMQCRLRVALKRGECRARAKTRALPDFCWSSAYLAQYEPDKPAAGHGHTRYITWARNGCPFISWTRPKILVLYCVINADRPPEGGPAETSRLSVTSLTLIFDIPSVTNARRRS